MSPVWPALPARERPKGLTGRDTRTASSDVSNFTKIRDAFAANTHKIANPAFKALC
jgi:hypothetical protein